MEFQQQQDEEMINHVGKMSNNTSNNNNNNNNNYLCRQSSTRWTPTTEQIKLLKDLYYLQGIRSPTADQIQSICARLRRYGKIEGKNVFYWFQNHKARERQKKKLTPTSPNNNNINNNNNNNFIRNNNNNGNINTFHAKYPCSFNNNNPGVSCSSSSAGVISGGGQLIGNFGYGAVTMENKFRDCSISGGGIPIPNGANQVNQWSNYFNPNTPTSYSNFFIDKVSSNADHHHYPYINHHDHDHDHDHYGPQSPEIQTLPLFPMHNDHHDHDHDLDLDHDHGFYTYKPQSDGCNYTGGYRWSSNVNGGHTSLELSLNSYGFGCYSPN